jgi:hypothetical protein
MGTENIDETSFAQGPTPAKPTAVAEILVKKQCEHLNCSHHKCERKDLRIGGIDI